NINDRSFVPNNNYYSKQCMKRRCEIEVFIHEHMYKQVKDEDGDMIDYITGLYDSAIHDVDRKLNRFINFLDSNNLLDNTIVIIVADHGEELGEHGHTYHISTLYEEELKVPFITIIPPNKVMNVDTTKYVSLIDVYPTLLDLVNISHPSVDGKNILKAKSEPDLNNRVIFADLNVELEKYALMEDSKKLILSKKGLSGWIQDNMIKGLNALEEHNQNTKVWSKNVTYFKIPFNGKNTFEIGSIMNPNSYIKDFSQGNKTLKYETIKNNSNWVYLVEVYRENTSVDDYLRMDVETFNLKKRGSSTDDRDLGLFIDWVLIRGDKNETFFTDLNKTSKTQEYECYDLKEDILEKNNLPLDKCPLNKKKEVLWEIGSISNTPHLLNRTLDKDIEEKLLALGYI
ncbi:MAG: sulfatase-like hydrolase/transferase, partial [Candidatus Altiarchaeota archaeon]|nr:sulfatase-like hydrolase/transferase [Candidatus Altiarchaeota archaeon]